MTNSLTGLTTKSQVAATKQRSQLGYAETARYNESQGIQAMSGQISLGNQVLEKRSGLFDATGRPALGHCLAAGIKPYGIGAIHIQITEQGSLPA